MKRFLLPGLMLLFSLGKAQITVTVTDTRDGNVYSTVRIGDQWWMSENLNYGIRINGNVSQANNEVVEKYCFDNLEKNCDTLGALCQWNDPQKSYGLSLRCLMDEPFTETISGLPQVRTSITKWCDYDNDGVMDLFLCGITSYPDGISDIYHNNGNGTFTALGAAFEKVSGSADWADYDCDGYADLLLAGYYNSDYITRLYRNHNGTGSFINVATGIPGARLVRWGDYDCDGDPDILVNQSDYTIEIYENKGTLDAALNLRTGIVFEKSETDFPSLQLASFDWGDYNNDGFPDIVIAGEDDIIHNKYCKIYRNNGNKTFTDLELMLRGASLGRVNWGDFDNDNDLDILLTGYTDDIQIYRNEGNDVFSYFNTPLVDDQIINAWFDFNNDGNLDVVLTGYDSSRVYSGDGQGNYKHLHCTLQNATSADLDIADYDADGDVDFVYSGFITSNNAYTRIYKNNTSVKNHEPQVPTGLIARQVGSDVVFSWNASVDKENGERLSYNITAGTSSDNCLIVSPLSKLTNGERLKLNRGNVGNDTTWVLKDAPVGTLYWSVQSIDRTLKSSVFAPFSSFEVKPPFSEMTISPELSHLAIKGNKFIDINNDGLLDILTSTMTEEGMMDFADVHCFMNQGNNSYTPGTITGPALGGIILPCNLNGDAFMDALLLGKVYIEEFHAEMKAYSMINNQTNGFIVSTGDFAPIILHDVPWNKSMNVTNGDFDNDGDEDIVFVGYKNDTLGTYLFRKEDAGYTLLDLGFLFYPQNQAIATCDVDGDMDLDMVIGGSVLKNEDGFTRLDIFPFADVESMDWGDFDGDGDLDAALSGLDTIGNRVSSIYENNGSLSFTPLSYKIRGFSYGACLRWLDYNNDGLLDLAASGNAGGTVLNIYINQGSSTFEPIVFTDYQLYDWGDSDNDGDLDMLGGETVYISNGNWTNTAPQAPTGLTCTLDEFDAVFSWDRAADDNNNSGLSYNIKLGNENGIYNVMPVLTTPGGQLLVPESGNVPAGTSWCLKNLPPGMYYWTVQAVDQAYKGGPWANASSFEIGDVFVDFIFDMVCSGDPTPFTDQSASRAGAITSWHWDFNDGTVSDQQHPVHIFPRAGKYYVKLIVTVNIDNYSVTKEVIVKHKPAADFTFEPVTEGGEIMRFDNTTDTSVIEVTEWKWDFGDEEVSYKKNPEPHAYLSTGMYTVQLSVTCANGCYDLATKEIMVCHGMFKKPDIYVFGPNVWYLVCSNNAAKYYKWYYKGAIMPEEHIYICVADQNLGEYRVAISNDDTCYVWSDVASVPPTGEKSGEHKDATMMYPNPGSGQFYICHLNTGGDPVRYRLTGIHGNEINSGEITAGTDRTVSFDFHHLADGVYFIEIFTAESRIFSGKLVVKK